MFIRPSRSLTFARLASGCAFACAAAAAACNSGEVGAPIDADSGAFDASASSDATVTGAGTDEDANAGANDAAFSADAAIPDAGCGLSVEDEIADSGALTASCAACYQSACATILAACDLNCACPNALDQALECVALGGTEQSCVDVALPVLGAATVLQLFQCTGTCKPECHQDAGADVIDAGDTSDASTADAGITDAAAD